MRKRKRDLKRICDSKREEDMHVIAEKIKKQKEILFISSLGDIQREDSEICILRRGIRQTQDRRIIELEDLPTVWRRMQKALSERVSKAKPMNA